jgi:hypothetical protein
MEFFAADLDVRHLGLWKKDDVPLDVEKREAGVAD